MSSQRQKCDSIGNVFGMAHFSNQFQIARSLPDGDIQLVGVNDTSKVFSPGLSLRCFRQEVFIHRDHDAAQLVARVSNSESLISSRSSS